MINTKDIIPGTPLWQGHPDTCSLPEEYEVLEYQPNSGVGVKVKSKETGHWHWFYVRDSYLGEDVFLTKREALNYCYPMACENKKEADSYVNDLDRRIKEE